MSGPAALEDLDWSADAIATIVGLAEAQALVTADDLRREMREPPHPNMTGQAFTAARARKLIRPVGYQTSTTKSRKHGVVRVWTRCDPTDRKSYVNLLDDLTAPAPTRAEARAILSEHIPHVLGSLRDGDAAMYAADLAQARRILSAAVRKDLDHGLFEVAAEYGYTLSQVHSGVPLAVSPDYLEDMISAGIDQLTAGIPE